MARLSAHQVTAVLVIVLTMATIFIAGNQSMRPDLMEVRNLVTAREMVYDHHIMVPTMNGDIRLEKPPLPTWVAAIVEYISPDNINAQRGVAAIMAMLWAMWLYLFTYQVTKRKKTALFATLLFATCYPVVLHARTATWDVFCHAFMMGSIYYIYRALYEDRYAMRHFILGGLLFGLSFMSKGPVSVYAMFLPFIISVLWYNTPKLKGKYTALILGIVVALVVSAWWYLYLIAFEPEATNYVINKESGSWINHNVRPWYYYWRFFLETGIWCILMLSSIVMWFKRHRFFDFHLSRQWSFFFFWTLIALVLLSLMPEKKMRYLLPMMVPCSLCMTYALEYISKASTLGRLFFQINKWAIAVITIALPAVTYYFIVQGGQMGIFTYIIFSLGCLVIVVWDVMTLKATQTYRLVTIVYTLFFWVALFIMPNLNSIFGNTTSRSITTLKNDPQLQKLPMLYVNTEEHAFRIDMVYLTHHKIKEIEQPALLDSTKTQFNKSLPIPCALLTDSATAVSIHNVASAQGLKTIDYGNFDDNISKRNKQHYKPGLCNSLIVLK